jgi:hypothetical protein
VSGALAGRPACVDNRRVRFHVGPMLLCLLADLPAARADQAAQPDCDVFYFGIGQQRDLKRAFACEMAEPEPKRNWVLIGVMNLNGDGTPRDLRRAREALEHNRPGECGVTCAALEEALRRQEAAPGKPHRRVDYCKDIAQTTTDVNYCLGVQARKEAFVRKREERDLSVGLAPAQRKRFAAVAQAFAKLKDADGAREYQNFKDGTIRSEAAEIMEKRVARHYRAALAAWGPRAQESPRGARSHAQADRELNEIYRRIMSELDAAIAEAGTASDAEERERGVQSATEVKTATRDAERAWLRYVAAWQGFNASVRPDDHEAAERLRAFLTEQRIRELKYPSIGAAGSLDPEDEQ